MFTITVIVNEDYFRANGGDYDDYDYDDDVSSTIGADRKKYYRHQMKKQAELKMVLKKWQKEYADTRAKAFQ